MDRRGCAPTGADFLTIVLFVGDSTSSRIVDGPWVQLRVNGQVLNEAWDCEVKPGKICLQSEGAEIHFRNISLVRLKK